MNASNINFGLPAYWEEMSRDERTDYLYLTRNFDAKVIA